MRRGGILHNIRENSEPSLFLCCATALVLEDDVASKVETVLTGRPRAWKDEYNAKQSLTAVQAGQTV